MTSGGRKRRTCQVRPMENNPGITVLDSCCHRHALRQHEFALSNLWYLKSRCRQGYAHPKGFQAGSVPLPFTAFQAVCFLWLVSPSVHYLISCFHCFISSNIPASLFLLLLLLSLLLYYWTHSKNLRWFSIIIIILLNTHKESKMVLPPQDPWYNYIGKVSFLCKIPHS